MRVRVLTVLPPQEDLRDSAAAFLRGDAGTSLRNIAVPDGFELDPSFAAVPVGKDDSLSAQALETAVSEHFAVRGYMEVESIDDMPETIGGQPVFSDPVIAPFLTCGGSAPVGAGADVGTKLNVAALQSRGLDGTGVAIAIMDTGINLAHLSAKLGGMPRFDAANSWRIPGNTTAPGAHPVDHGTMCAYDALIAAPKATLVDFPILSARAPGGALSGSTLSVALQAYAQLMASWSIAGAPGGLQNYKGLVISNSWGMFHPSWDFPAGHPGRYIDNPNHTFTLMLGILARSGADILFAAGNCGAQCADGRCQARTTETIMGASASADVLTLAGCDTGDMRVGYSSQGPSIVGMFLSKPDLTCYTHFLGSEAFGANSPDSGTSAACPVAAGCVAALRTKISPSAQPSANLFQQLITTARPKGGPGGWNGDYGHGIIDPNQAAQILGV